MFVLLIGLPQAARAQTGACTASDAPAAYSGGSCTVGGIPVCAMDPVTNTWVCDTEIACPNDPVEAWSTQDYDGNGSSDYSTWGECIGPGTYFCCAHDEQQVDPVDALTLLGTDESDQLSFWWGGTNMLKPARPDPLTATIKGRENIENPEYIIGSNFDDLSYKEFLCGDSGDEVMYGNDGRDYLDGGTGDDFMDGGGAADEMHGGPGDDLMYGAGGDDLMYEDDGADYMEGNDASDRMDGGLHYDELYGNGGHDSLCDTVGISPDCSGGLLESGIGNDNIWFADTATCPATVPTVDADLGADACGDFGVYGLFLNCEMPQALTVKPISCPP